MITHSAFFNIVRHYRSKMSGNQPNPTTSRKAASSPGFLLH
jgi:hypothetical protein